MASAALAGLAILIVGESHLSFEQNLTNPLVDDLTAQGAKVHAVGGCGAVAGDWIVSRSVPCGGDRRSNEKGTFTRQNVATTPIKELIAHDHPDVVVVIIGDTMAAYDHDGFPTAWVWKSTTGLTKEIASTKTTCVWVGPPWGSEGGTYKKNDKRTEFMSNFLAKNVSPCIYVDSLTMAKPRQWVTVDGQHFTESGYKQWSAGITKALISIPAVLRLKKP